MVVDFHMVTEALDAPADSSCHLFSQIPWLVYPNRCAYISAWELNLLLRFSVLRYGKLTRP